MSFKIYEAYRIKPGPRGHTTAFLIDARHRAEQEVRRLASLHLATILLNKTEPEVRDPILQYILGPEATANPTTTVTALDAWHALQACLIDATTTPYRSDLDPEVSLRCYQTPRTTIIIPWADGAFREAWDWLRDDPRLTDWSYWNNGDPPKTTVVSHQAWRARKRFWTEQVLPHKAAQYILDVTHIHNLYHFNPIFDLYHEDQNLRWHDHAELQRRHHAQQPINPPQGGPKLYHEHSTRRSPPHPPSDELRRAVSNPPCLSTPPTPTTP